MSIHKINEKIKLFTNKPIGRDILSVFLIILINLGSFYLGKQSTIKNTNSQVIVTGAKGVIPVNTDPKLYALNNDTGPQQTEQKTAQNVYEKGNYLASRRGKKYYPVDCPASQNIKEANRVYFKTATEAESKGYSLSSSCN